MSKIKSVAKKGIALAKEFGLGFLINKLRGIAMVFLKSIIDKIMGNAAREFQRYGIELSANSYTFGKDKVPAIQGVNNPDDLRWGSWAVQFYTAGLDEKIIIAEIEEARYYIKVHLDRIKKRLGAAYPIFYSQFQRSAHLRGIFQAAYNNLPLAAKNGTYDAVMAFKANPSQDFVALFAEKLKLAYRRLNDPEGAGRLIKVTGQGSALVGRS